MSRVFWSPHRILFIGGGIMFVIAIWFMMHESERSDEVTARDSLVVGEEEMDPYEKPMCNAEGTCGENPSTPSPRTTFSSPSASQEKEWFEFHEKLKRSAHKYKTTSTTQYLTKDVVFLGDSISESFLGTSYDDETNPRLNGIKQVFQEFCHEHGINPLVLAISGDQTQHLLYRLQDGELSKNLKYNPDITFVLHIGTNNIGSGFLPPETAKGVINVAEYLIKETQGKLLLVLLLPRGDGELKLSHLCPPRCDTNGHPFLSYLSPLRKVNELIMEWFDGLKSSLNNFDGGSRGRVDVISCWDLFINENNKGVEDVHDKNYDLANEVHVNLMPDKLHPNAQGHKLFLNRIITSTLFLSS